MSLVLDSPQTAKPGEILFNVPNLPGLWADAVNIVRMSGQNLTVGYAGSQYVAWQDGKVVAIIDLTKYRLIPIASDAPADAMLSVPNEPIKLTTQPAFVPRGDVQGDPSVSAPQEPGTPGEDYLRLDVDGGFTRPDGNAQSVFVAGEIQSNPAFLILAAGAAAWFLFGR